MRRFVRRRCPCGYDRPAESILTRNYAHDETLRCSLAENRPDPGDERLIVRAVRFVSWIALPVTVVLILGRIYLSILNGDVMGAAEVVVNVLPDL